jgi:hypothetical protein
LHLVPTPFGHRPATSGTAIKRHIQGAEVFGVAAAEAAGEGVVGREDAADKSDDAEAVLSVVAQGVDIPPEITTLRDRLVESRCAISVAAAKRPDMAAIGTPGPGCTLPPAK